EAASRVSLTSYPLTSVTDKLQSLRVDVLDLRENRALEDLRERHRAKRRSDSQHRSVQNVKALFNDLRNDFSAKSAEDFVFVDDQRLCSLSNRCDYRVDVQRHKRTKIDDLGFNSLFVLQLIRSADAPMNRRPVADHSEVASLVSDSSLAKGNLKLVTGIGRLCEYLVVEVLRFKIEGDPTAAHRVSQQPDRVVGKRRRDYPQTGQRGEDGFEVLRVIQPAGYVSARRQSRYDVWHKLAV